MLICTSAVSSAEQRYIPQSCEKLSNKNGKKLKSLMDEVSVGVILSKLTFWAVSILWAMDEHGDIYFAVEEVLDGRGRLMFPLPDSLDTPVGKVKLGHPSLIKCAKARIAGEINFDMNAASPGWVISNKSGRYGLRKTTTRAHLDNVVDVFSKYNITLAPYFIPGNR
jgi:hypothetical protein